MTPFIEKFLEYRHAGFPILYVQTHEEQRVVAEFADLFEDADWQDPIYHWSSVVGLRQIGSEAQPERETNAIKVLERLLTLPSGSVVVLKDAGISPLCRYLRDLIGHLEGTNKTLVFVSPGVAIPMELEKDVTLLAYPLPTREQLGAILGKMVLEQEAEHKITIDISGGARVAGMASGLTTNEARNAFALALGRHGRLDDAAARTVLGEKAGALKRSGLVKWIEPSVGIDDVGGLGRLKQYIASIAPLFHEYAKAKAYGLLDEDFPRSIALVGMPGCGKSLAAETVATVLGIGLIQTDFGRIFSSGGGRVGAAESAIEERNKIVEAQAPVVDWCDEMEKGIQGALGHSSQNPWEARIAGTFLTWLESFRAPILVVGTINRHEMLPPEMLSRFQRVFWVDFPTEEERVEIFSIHIKKRKLHFDGGTVASLAAATTGFNGREIRNIIQSAMQVGFSTGKAVDRANIFERIKEITPLSVLRADDLKILREWAAKNNVQPAALPTKEKDLVRKIRRQ